MLELRYILLTFSILKLKRWEDNATKVSELIIICFCMKYLKFLYDVFIISLYVNVASIFHRFFSRCLKYSPFSLHIQLSFIFCSCSKSSLHLFKSFVFVFYIAWFLYPYIDTAFRTILIELHNVFLFELTSILFVLTPYLLFASKALIRLALVKHWLILLA